MNSPSVSLKTLLTILFIAGLVMTPALVRAQDYTDDDFKVWEGVQAEKDDVKKVDMIVKFLQEKPKNGLRPNMVAEYQKIVVDLKNEKKWGQIVTLCEKFIAVAPGDDFTENALTLAYSETNNWRGFATYAEKAYASKPSGALAMEIVRAYQKLGNEAKALQWKEKVLASDPDNIEMLADTMKRYAAAQNNAQSIKYAKQCLSVLPTAKKPEGVEAAKWKETVDQTYAIAYGIIGQDAYQRSRFAEAIKSLDLAVKYFKRNDGAYLLLGMSYWQTGKLDAAMLNFAKAYVIKGSVANQAKGNLEKLYKQSSRSASSAGLQRIIDRAMQDLK